MGVTKWQGGSHNVAGWESRGGQGGSHRVAGWESQGGSVLVMDMREKVDGAVPDGEGPCSALPCQG